MCSLRIGSGRYSCPKGVLSPAREELKIVLPISEYSSAITGEDKGARSFEQYHITSLFVRQIHALSRTESDVP